MRATGSGTAGAGVEAGRSPGGDPAAGEVSRRGPSESVRFWDLLHRRPRRGAGDEESGTLGGPAAGLGPAPVPAFGGRVGSGPGEGAAPEGGVVRGAPDPGGWSLREVAAASGDGAAAVAFTVDEGRWAGLRLEFLLRGSGLAVSLGAPDAAGAERLRAREAEVRAALAERGMHLERYEADGGGGRGRDEGDRGEPPVVPPRRSRRG